MTKDGARGYSWPPFEPGNDAAVKHGADTDERVRPIASDLLADLADAAPWTTSPAFAHTARAWAWAEARCSLIRSWLAERDVVDDKGNVPPAASYLERIEARAANLRAQLGLDPTSLGRLLSTAASVASVTGDVDAVEAIRREGARLLEVARPPATDAKELGA